MVDISIIMINHNTKKLTTQAIQSILDSKPKCNYEIIVVDNSTDCNEQVTFQDERVRILAGVENKGFAHGCNIGVAVAEGAYFLFLNSDTIMKSETLDKSLEYLQEHPKIGGLGVKLIKEDGTLDHACKRGFPTPWNAFCYFSKLDRMFPKTKLFNGYCLRYLSDDAVHQVDAVNGAYLMMPRDVCELTGGWDETFFMYGEDLDLCYKIHLAGYDIVYNPLLSCIHLKGKSGRESDNPFVQYHFYNAMIIFYERYYKDKYLRPVTRIIMRVLENKKNQYLEQMK